MYDSANNGRVRRRGENVMGKIASAIVAVTLFTSPLLLPVPASAENGQIAAGVVGGLIGGGVLCGALGGRAAPPPPPGFFGSGALLGWIWLAISSSPGLRLIAARFGQSRRELTQVNQLEANWAPLFPALGHAQPWRVATSAASLPPVAVPRSPTNSLLKNIRSHRCAVRPPARWPRAQRCPARQTRHCGMRDQQLALQAVSDARRILEEYLEPDRTITSASLEAS